MKSTTTFIEQKLKLKVNRDKPAVDQGLGTVAIQRREYYAS